MNVGTDNGGLMLGATVLFASSHPCESCGSNGLPLTPNSIKIIGRFQILKTIEHPNLCQYVAVHRGKQERIVIVSEHHKDNLLVRLQEHHDFTSEEIVKIAHGIAEGLAHLALHGLVHRHLVPENVILDSTGQVKLANYGLYHMTDCGSCVSFPIGVPPYMAPEVLACGLLTVDHSASQPTVPSAPNVDVWSLGIILLELFSGCRLWSDLPVKQVIRKTLMLLINSKNKSALSSLLDDASLKEKYEDMPADLKSLIESCLHVDPSNRPRADELLKMPLFTSRGLAVHKTTLKLPVHSFPTMELRSLELEIPVYTDVVDEDHLGERSLKEVYHLWELAGGDVDAELRRQGMIKTKPPICSLPKVIIEEGEMFGQKKDRAFLLDLSVVILPLHQLRQRLAKIPPEAFYPLIEDESVKQVGSSNSMSDLTETARLPLIIREKDIEYQFNRIVLYHRLLLGYPYKRAHIWKEARVDIPPFYRAHAWAALLEIEGDVQRMYNTIDKETPTITDRQIEVDIPRCHQYDELLSSPTGHAKFKRLLKAWVVSHTNYVYWQGLDSLCAPFLYLDFNDEALAYACFSAFIDKYLHLFFLRDNSPIIQEYLAVFSHLIAFHDPELTNHLNSIGFIPELYAIPWFLTMYTHVFPLHKIFHLWDTLLLGNASFPLCIGVAILQQLRDNLLSFGFNECILLFSDMPEIDIERCVRDSIRIFCSTPKSATYREHERPQTRPRFPRLEVESPTLYNYSLDSKDTSPQDTKLGMDPISLDVLKSELCPRISAEDLVELIGKDQSSWRTKQFRTKAKLFVVDVRSSEEKLLELDDQMLHLPQTSMLKQSCHMPSPSPSGPFLRGALPDSVNIPFQTAFCTEGKLNPCQEVTALNVHRGRLIVVVGQKGSHPVNFAKQLIELGFPRVCTLHKGISALRHTGLLVVPGAEVRSPT